MDTLKRFQGSNTIKTSMSNPRSRPAPTYFQRPAKAPEEEDTRDIQGRPLPKWPHTLQDFPTLDMVPHWTRKQLRKHQETQIGPHVEHKLRRLDLGMMTEVREVKKHAYIEPQQSRSELWAKKSWWNEPVMAKVKNEGEQNGQHQSEESGSSTK